MLYLGKNDKAAVYRDVQLDLDAVFAWCNINQITLNQAKTEYIEFSYRKSYDIPDNPLKIGNKRISKTISYKYLGTEIDEKLNCQAQYKNVTRKLSAKKITFAKIRYLLTTEAVISVYKVCIQPLFDYNDFYYALLAKKYCKKLQAMQYRFLRIVFIGSNFTRNVMLERVGIMDLTTMRKVHLAGLMFKRAKNPEYIDERRLPTRQFDKKVLKVPDVNLTKIFKSPIYEGSTLWNALPRYIQDSETFKKNLNISLNNYYNEWLSYLYANP